MNRSKSRFGSSLPDGPASNRRVGTHNFTRHSSLIGVRGWIKRAFDILGAGVALMVLSPVLGVVALAIRLLDGSPVLFRQIRVGLDGRHFTILKFRTMIPDAEQDLGAIWAVPGDPRCTRIGTRLRRFGVDELPQLWNVLRGDMTLVGPRPERPEFTREFRREHRIYDMRHAVRTGITGYAQIYGWCGFTSLEERLRHDLYYVRNWSLRLDVYILLMTIVRTWSETTRHGA